MDFSLIANYLASPHFYYSYFTNSFKKTLLDYDETFFQVSGLAYATFANFSLFCVIANAKSSTICVEFLTGNSNVHCKGS